MYVCKCNVMQSNLINVCMYGWMDGCMYVCMWTYINIHAHAEWCRFISQYLSNLNLDSSTCLAQAPGWSQPRSSAIALKLVSVLQEVWEQMVGWWYRRISFCLNGGWTSWEIAKLTKQHSWPAWVPPKFPLLSAITMWRRQRRCDHRIIWSYEHLR